MYSRIFFHLPLAPEKWRIAQIFSSKQRFKRTFSWTNNFSPKMPMFVCISKKPNWVPAEWCWRLRFESTLNYFVKILRNNNKISHCALKSQPSAPFSCTQFGFFEIQTNMGIFWKDSFFYHKCPLEVLFWRKYLSESSQYWCLILLDLVFGLVRLADTR